MSWYRNTITTTKHMNAQQNQIELTAESRSLFESVVKDLPNWNGTTPCFNHIDSQSRGNLTDLKKKGLVKTYRYDGEEWIDLTEAGTGFARAEGLIKHQ